MEMTTKGPAGDPMSGGSSTVIRTRVYRARWTPALDDALTRCRHQQRALYNRTISAVAPQGGVVPAAMKSPGHPDGLYGQLTQWRSETSWIADIPVALARARRSRKHAKRCKGMKQRCEPGARGCSTRPRRGRDG